MLALVTAAALGMSGVATTSPAEAHRDGHPPAKPRGLNVDDVARPLNTDLTPRFGWLPQDRDGDEVQTAYEVEVRDAERDRVWDSGKVTSSQQSYVDYDGDALEPGSTYHWRVRTWDKDDQRSRWSAYSAFDTGLRDEDWGAAQWIRRPPGNPDASALTVVDGRGVVSGGDVTIAKPGAEWTDYVVSMKVTPVTHSAGVVFRATDSGDGYMWQLSADDDALKTHRMTDGSFPRDARRAVSHPIDIAQTYDLSIRVDGQTFTTSIDGKVVDTWTDPSPTGSTAGTIGLREANGEVGEFDDIRVTSLDGKTELFEENFGDGLDQWVRGTTKREADEYTLARKEVDLPRGRIVRARTYLAASHTAELYLNGRRADRMSNYGYPGEGYYQAADVTRLVKDGEPLTIAALSHWFSGGQGRAAREPGLLVRLVVEYADGRNVEVVSDGTWKVRRGPYRMAGTRNGEGLYIEHLDGDVAADIGAWKSPGYDEGDWPDAVALGTHPVEPFTHLVGRQTRLTETVVHPRRILIADDGTPVADFGRVIPARPGVHFEKGEAGREIAIRGSLGLAENGRVSTASTDTQSTNMTWPYTQTDGEQDYRSFGHLAFRYLEIPDSGERITARDVTATIVHTDLPRRGDARLNTSNRTLNEVFRLMQRSARYSVQETFVDTPTREQGQFLHDTVNISYALMASANERVATRQAIHEFMASQERYWTDGDDAGRYNAVYPNGDGKRDIPDFTETVPSWVWRYYLETGDRAMLSDVYDNVAATADYVRRHIAATGPTEGLVTRLSGGSGPYKYGIVDWPEHGRFGYDMETAARTTVNALGVDVLRKTALIGAAIDRPEAEVEEYVQEADALADRMNQSLRRPDGIYTDGLLADGTQSSHAGQHATAYAVAFGIAPADDRSRLGDYLSSLGMRQGPMTAHVLLEALADTGAGDGLLDVLTNEDDYGWAGWLADGGTFTPEAWELSGSANSGSHGWGARGVVDVLDSVLGIEVTSPGASEIRISIPDTGLRKASGSQVTQRGRVSTSWRRHGDGVRLATTIPVNVSAVIELPAGEYDVRGPRGTEAERLGTDDGVTSYQIGSGRWRFISDRRG